MLAALLLATSSCSVLGILLIDNFFLLYVDFFFNDDLFLVHLLFFYFDFNYLVDLLNNDDFGLVHILMMHDHNGFMHRCVLNDDDLLVNNMLRFLVMVHNGGVTSGSVFDATNGAHACFVFFCKKYLNF